jgi:hypothetical protein
MLQMYAHCYERRDALANAVGHTEDREWRKLVAEFAGSRDCVEPVSAARKSWRPYSAG